MLYRGKGFSGHLEEEVRREVARSDAKRTGEERREANRPKTDKEEEQRSREGSPRRRGAGSCTWRRSDAARRV